MAKYKLKDVALAQFVQNAFTENQRLAALPIKVSASDGTIYLSGRVKTAENLKEAETVAAGAIGVKHVINNLVVSRNEPDQLT